MKRTLLLALPLVLLAGIQIVKGQSHAPSPYAGEKDRTVKALSEAEIDGYRNGEGMGFARAAELNSYPGPRHVLELRDELDLAPDQVTQVQAVYEAMHAEAVRLGEEIVAKEKSLDALFAGSQATPEAIAELTESIGLLQGRLRFVHLHAHLQLKELMTEAQIQHYDMLRGYGTDSGGDHQHRPGHKM